MELVFLEVTRAAINFSTGATPNILLSLVRLDVDGYYVLISKHSVADQTLEFRLHVLGLWVLKDDSFCVWNVLFPLFVLRIAKFSFGWFILTLLFLFL